MTEAKLRFMCEQLREWGGLPEDDIRRIYEAEQEACKQCRVIPIRPDNALAFLSARSSIARPRIDEVHTYLRIGSCHVERHYGTCTCSHCGVASGRRSLAA